MRPHLKNEGCGGFKISHKKTCRSRFFQHQLNQSKNDFFFGDEA